MTVSRLIGAAGVTFVASCLSTPPPAADVDASLDSCVGGNFVGGTLDRTRVLGTGFLGLASGETMGYWTSPVYPAGPNGRFTKLRWETVRPSLKALPDNRARETLYTQGSADLAENQMLFHFDDPPAWDDSSGNNLATMCAATPQDQCPMVVPGLFRDAIEFDVDADGASDNDNDRLRIPSVMALEPTDEVTIETWVRPNRMPTNGARMMIVHKGTATPSVAPFASYSIEYNSNGTFRCYANISTAGEELVDGTRMSAPMQWHHVACTYDGVALRLFVDGYPDGSVSAVGTLVYGLTGSDDVFMGDYNGAQFLDGAVDELAVHRVALLPGVVTERARRGALRLAWQVRVCDDAACEGEDNAWVGPTGTALSQYSESCSTSLAQPDLDLSDLDCDGDLTPDDGADLAVPTAPFIQARVLLDSHRPPDTPELMTWEICE
jgi:hypothetical protein